MKKIIIICMLLTFAVLISPLSANANIWKKTWKNTVCLFTGDHCHKNKGSNDISDGSNGGSSEIHGSGNGNAGSIVAESQVAGVGNGDGCLFTGACGGDDNKPVSVSVPEPSSFTMVGSGLLCFGFAYLLRKRNNITN